MQITEEQLIEDILCIFRRYPEYRTNFNDLPEYPEFVKNKESFFNEILKLVQKAIDSSYDGCIITSGMCPNEMMKHVLETRKLYTKEIKDKIVISIITEIEDYLKMNHDIYNAKDPNDC